MLEAVIDVSEPVMAGTVEEPAHATTTGLRYITHASPTALPRLPLPQQLQCRVIGVPAARGPFLSRHENATQQNMSVSNMHSVPAALAECGAGLLLCRNGHAACLKPWNRSLPHVSEQSSSMRRSHFVAEVHAEHLATEKPSLWHFLLASFICRNMTMVTTHIAAQSCICAAVPISTARKQHEIPSSSV